MPWEIVAEGNGFVVKNKETGKKMGKHPTKADAQKQLRALYANVPEARR